MLEEKFRTEANLRDFWIHDLEWLRSYAPEVLVATLEVALSLAEKKRQGRFELPSLRTAIVVLTSLKEKPLGRNDRDVLWRSFGVPVFEQLRGWNGSIFARECEVHDGLHVEESAGIQLHKGELLVHEIHAGPIPTGWSAAIVTGLCECGAETPRLLNIVALPPKLAVAAA